VQISITYDGILLQTNPAQIVTENNGSFIATFKVPSGAAGAHNISVTDSISSLTAQFTSSATATVNITSGSVGTSINATGSGFKPKATVTIKFDDAQIATATTDDHGNLNTTFQSPPSSAGTHQITISDGTNSQRSSFTTTPSARISPTTGVVGGEVTINGTGFAASKEVSVKYDTQQIASANSDKSGSFTAVFKAPVSKGGNHNIIISDGTNTNTFIFAMDSTPPPVPELLFPTQLSKADKMPTLDWEDVNDPSGVTYSLEVAADSTFSIPIIKKQGLTFSVYKLAESEKLQSAGKSRPYYWRVKATDAASNESSWSEASTFIVGIVIPGWVLNTVLGVMIILFGAGGFILGRISGRKSTSTGVIVNNPENQQ
jgi:hypothetical protein